MNNKRLIASIVEIVLGIVLTVCGALGVVDSYWSGMGSALIVVGAIFLIRQIRYKTDKTYQENVDVENHDERNRYIGMKAWSWAGYLFVMISAVASIALKIAGLDLYSRIAGFAVCILIILYWVSYLILRKKY
jgi:hypothetical protein